MYLPWKLTSLWLVGLESSSGYGLVTPMATQLAKMASRMKISKGLRIAVKGTTGLVSASFQKNTTRPQHTYTPKHILTNTLHMCNRCATKPTQRRIFPLYQGQCCHADGVAEGEAAEGSGGPEGRLVRLHRLLGPPSSFSGGASRPEGVWFSPIAPRRGICQ